MNVLYTAGSEAPLNVKASLATNQELCFECGRKLGKNPLYFEVNTSWQIIAKGSDRENSQGCFPVGASCANKFEDGLLFRLDLAVA